MTSSSNSLESTRPVHLLYRRSALGRIAHPFKLSLVIMSGQVEFLSPVVDVLVIHVG